MKVEEAVALVDKESLLSVISPLLGLFFGHL